jgi:hypothetical protein
MHILVTTRSSFKKKDEEKTAFITPYGVFCYQVMPFGQKMQEQLINE